MLKVCGNCKFFDKSEWRCNGVGSYNFGKALMPRCMACQLYLKREENVTKKRKKK